MSINEWRLLRESLQGGTLGLGQRSTIGGVMGSRLRKEWEDDEDDEDNDNDAEDVYEDDEDEEGPTKDWPPDSGEDADGLPTPDEEMIGADDFGEDEGGDDFLTSVGAGHDGSHLDDDGQEDDFSGYDFSGDDFADDIDASAEEEEPDMDFLGDVDPNLVSGDSGDEIGGEVGGETCPDCNSHGDEVGDPDCETCGGTGFLDDDHGGDLGGDENFLDDDHGGDENFLDDDHGGDLGGDENFLDDDDDIDVDGSHEDFAGKMAAYMKKYMKKENVYGGQPMQQQMQQPMQPNGVQPAPVFAQPSQRRMVKFMSKRGERSFMAADAPKKRESRQHCHCESVGYDDANDCCTEEEFFNSLIKSARGSKRGKSGVSEDALFALADPNAEYARGEPVAGDVGFAPQGRIGGLGGGYTQADLAEIPTLGESRRRSGLPTLTEYVAMKARNRRSGR